MKYVDINIVNAQHVISYRAGSVLIKNTLLKADHFPGCQNLNLTPNIPEAPNFRKVDGFPIYGVGCPSASGIKIILGILDSENSKRKVLWHNMREEPLIYINGNPYVVREADRPFANLEYTGIDRVRVEEMEHRLKKDILEEVQKYNGNVLLAGETEDYKMTDFWESVTESEIQTPQELYQDLVSLGYDIDYLRVPVTDEKAPKESDFDLLIQRCWSPPPGSALIFNCQMGRGRTTTGMIITSLLCLRKINAFPLFKCEEVEKKVPEWFVLHNDKVSSARYSDFLKSGMYNVVRSLLRVLECGVEGKKVLDKAINACSAMQNLREAILTYRDRLFSEREERRKNSLLNVCLQYLERYCVLIAFASYISHPQFDPESEDHVTFVNFMSDRPVYRGILQRLLLRNPFSALELPKPEEVFAEKRIAESETEALDEIVANRCGRVLGSNTILKEEHFPSLQSKAIPQYLDGAPNFRSVANLPVYGTCLPTVDGIKSIIEIIGLPLIQRCKGQGNIIWYNLREEPVVYINGKPFVLREESRPFKNLKEYIKIKKRHLEKMELRLKQDILKEAKHFGGKILVAMETSGREESDSCCLVEKWEIIKSADAVNTPAEVYQILKNEGYPVSYYRVPDSDDIDQILRNIEEEEQEGRDGNESALVFSCQSGVGRTTIGMIVGCLYRIENYSPSFIRAFSETLKPIYNQKLNNIKSKSESKTGNKNSNIRLDINQDLLLNSERLLSFEEKSFNESSQCIAVRRIVRLLDSSKYQTVVDKVIDACGSLINIRTEITNCTSDTGGQSKPEMGARHLAFSRKVMCLKRYCLMIAIAAFLRRKAKSSKQLHFKDWMCQRSDIRLALKCIDQNPSESLSVLPFTLFHELVHNLDGACVSREEEMTVLQKRQGHILTSWTVLKTDHMDGANLAINKNQILKTNITDLKKVQGRNIYTIGSLDVESLRKLLIELGAGPEGKEHVVLSDMREELYVYVGGRPCIRRDLERPLSSLHNTGIRVKSLERMERVLKDDAITESELWDGYLLLHNEVNLRSSDVHGKDRCVANMVVPIWTDSLKNSNVSKGISSIKEIFKGLVGEGFKVSYMRIPLSKERRLNAEDLDMLGQNISQEDSIYVIMSRTNYGSSARFAANFICCYLDWRCNSLKISHHSKMVPSINPITNLSESSSNEAYTARDYNLNCSVQAVRECRGIMNLCRVISNGLNCKAAVDQAIDACHDIGSLREDLIFSKNMAEKSEKGKSKSQSLCLHDLQRYFILVAYRCFLEEGEGKSYSEWLRERKEIMHLLKSLDFNK